MQVEISSLECNNFLNLESADLSIVVVSQVTPSELLEYAVMIAIGN